MPALVPSPVHYTQTADGPILTAEGRALIVGSSTHTLVQSMMTTARSHADVTGSLGCTWVETVHGVEVRAHWMREDAEPEPDATFSLDAVVKALQQRGIPAYVEQTGGGCATLYAGGMHVTEQDGELWNRWNVAAGPGHFTGPGWTKGVAYLCEFSVGPNDDGDSPSTSLPDTIKRADDAVCWAVEQITMAVTLWRSTH